MNTTSENRPWGSYKVIDEAHGFKVKRISVNPGQMLSLQLHDYRAERWVVAAGQATVTVGAKTCLLAAGDTTFIPVGERHRLANYGTEQLELIELQMGQHLEESDIHRIEDNYGRA